MPCTLRKPPRLRSALDSGHELTLFPTCAGVKESDTGLAQPSQWDLISDKQMMQEEHPLQVARCTQIMNAGQDDAKYVINLKQYAKFVVALGDKVSPTDIEEGMRVGVERQKYKIQVCAQQFAVRTRPVRLRPPD